MQDKIDKCLEVLDELEKHIQENRQNTTGLGIMMAAIRSIRLILQGEED